MAVLTPTFLRAYHSTHLQVDPATGKLRRMRLEVDQVGKGEVGGWVRAGGSSVAAWVDRHAGYGGQAGRQAGVLCLAVARHNA